MKILWFSHLIPYPPKGGVLQRSYNLLKELAGHHQVSLLAFNQQALLASTFTDPEAGMAEARHQLEGFCEQVQILPIPADRAFGGKGLLAVTSLLSRHPYTINWLKSAAMRNALKETLARGDFDWVHFDTISLAPYLDIAAGHRTALGHHNIESHMLLRRGEIDRNPLKKFYFWQEGLRLARYEKRLCSRFDLNITCSELDSDRLRKMLPEVRVESIPNGVDLDFFQPGDEAETPDSVIFAGTMDWYPNRTAMHYFAGQVWPKLKAACPGAVMHVVGANPSAHLKAQADERFLVHGFVDDVRPYIDRAAVYVCPITDGGGTKLKVLDALSMGKALVAHPVACEGIGVTDGKDVLFATSADEYVAHITRLFADPDLRRTLGENGRKLMAEQYAYPAIGRRLAALFDTDARS